VSSEAFRTTGKQQKLLNIPDQSFEWLSKSVDHIQLYHMCSHSVDSRSGIGEVLYPGLLDFATTFLSWNVLVDFPKGIGKKLAFSHLFTSLGDLFEMGIAVKQEGKRYGACLVDQGMIYERNRKVMHLTPRVFHPVSCRQSLLSAAVALASPLWRFLFTKFCLQAFKACLLSHLPRFIPLSQKRGATKDNTQVRAQVRNTYN